MSSARSWLGKPLSRLPIRIRLAVAVATVAFVILTVFAVVVARLNAHRVRSDFYSQVDANSHKLYELAQRGIFQIESGKLRPLYPLTDLGIPAAAVLRVLTNDGSHVLLHIGGANLGDPVSQLPNPEADLRTFDTTVNGYRVVNIPVQFNGPGGGSGWLQYAQPLSSISGEIGDLELLLLFGVLAGTLIAFGAGWIVARRSIAPIAQLTAVAREIEQTRDPSRTLPEPIADDEVAELSRTLSGMLTSLAGARSETEAMLERQRDFVADASHELRTPLTSVLANLELLVDSLHGADREAAESALRSTQRMRRLVADLLLLARADAGHAPSRAPFDLADVVVDAASELEPASQGHTIELDVSPTPVLGSRDELQRVATNLIENALRHTPPGTRVTASARSLPDGTAELVVADDGPGIAPEARSLLFQRFVRGGGDRGGSFGLGLAIVAAVAQAHGGSVAVDESPHGGARFTMQLPGGAAAAAAMAPPQEQHAEL